jgi:hypothetical protein
MVPYKVLIPIVTATLPVTKMDEFSKMACFHHYNSNKFVFFLNFSKSKVGWPQMPAVSGRFLSVLTVIRFEKEFPSNEVESTTALQAAGIKTERL